MKFYVKRFAKLKGFIFFVAFIALARPAHTQTLPVGLLENTDDLVRRQQLLGLDSTKSSLMIRPIFLKDKSSGDFPSNSGLLNLQDWNKTLWKNKSGSAEIKLLPLTLSQQINTHHPYGWNDGAMVPARGYQALVSGGFFAKIWHFSVQLRPEYVYAENKRFRESLQANNPADLQSTLVTFYNRIDLPERFGSGAYSKMDFGQSSIRLNFDPISFGLSNESLWWGAGVRNSLLMSNNAPGFKHLTLNTTRPVSTPIGSFEAQLIAGHLENSGLTYGDYAGVKTKRNSWRYISGVVITLQPKWVPGLFVGFDRTFTMYHNDLGGSLKNYLPFFSSLQKKSFINSENTDNSEDQVNRDQIFSVFGRWVLPEAHAEVYLQYGREDHSWDTRDLLSEPEHSRAYVAGFRKLIPLARESEYIQVGVELTQTEAAGTKAVRGGTSWYVHGGVKQGYTNRGQILGAGIGPDNLQSIDVDWVKGLKKIGITLERRTRNNEIYYRAFSYEARRHWTDLGFGAKFDWDYKRFLLSSKLFYIKSLNYQYQLENPNPTVYWDWDKQDVNNFHLKIGLAYLW